MKGVRRIPLAMLDEGEEGVVAEVRGGPGLVRRLVDLGFTPGVRVKMLKRNAPGPVLVEVRGFRVALGWGVARRIFVEVT